MLARIIVAPLAALLFCGCSTTATIYRTDGRTIEAKIRDSTSSSLMVQTDQGSEARIPRSEITDIDHPGNATAVVGGLLGIYGGFNIALGAPQCSKGASFCTGVFLPAILGTSMLIWGLSTWSDSSSAASGPARSSSSTVPAAPQSSAFDF